MQRTGILAINAILSLFLDEFGSVFKSVIDFFRSVNLYVNL